MITAIIIAGGSGARMGQVSPAGYYYDNHTK